MQTTRNSIIFPLDTLDKSFNNHITLNDNARIILSGRFGSGKTYFLNHFFKDKEYEVFHLFPVNYSVACNEDIFELIKYDILFELVGKEIITPENDSITTSIALQYTLMHESYNILKLLLSLNKTFGKGSELIKAIKTFICSISEKIKEYQKDNFSTIQDYVHQIDNQKGSIYEADQITNIIYGEIQSIEKKSVLIIDDLDRIDPEHIFRILNIFAAHFDQKSDENIFGFDKIILVCDINNIKNIFAHKYGSATDFNGYIDKFYSNEIFYFYNREGLQWETKNILSTITFHRIIIKESVAYQGVIDVLLNLIMVGELTIRQLKNKENLKIDKEFFELEEILTIRSDARIGTILISFLLWILGTDTRGLIAQLSNSPNIIWRISSINNQQISIIESLLYFVIENNTTQITSSDEYIYNSHYGKTTFHLKNNRGNDYILVLDEEPMEIDFTGLLIDVLDKINRHGIQYITSK